MKPQVISNHDKPWDEMALRCSVGCDDFMVFTVEDIGEPGEPDWWVEVSLVGEMRPDGFWDFLKACWRLFRDGRYWRGSANMSRGQLEAVRDWCQYALDKTKEM